MGIQPDKRGARKNDTGESVFPETDLFSLFLGSLIYFLLCKGMNIESRGVSRPDLYQNQVLHIKDLRGFWPGGLLTFYDPFFLITVSQPENLFFPGMIFS